MDWSYRADFNISGAHVVWPTWTMAWACRTASDACYPWCSLARKSDPSGAARVRRGAAGLRPAASPEGYRYRIFFRSGTPDSLVRRHQKPRSEPCLDAQRVSATRTRTGFWTGFVFTYSRSHQDFPHRYRLYRFARGTSICACAHACVCGVSEINRYNRYFSVYFSNFSI